MSFTIEVNNANVLAAFNRLLQLGQDMNPILRDIGEDIADRAKRRFDTSTAPDGTRWAPNSPVTYALMVNGFGKRKPGFSKSNLLDDGRVNADGGARPARFMLLSSNSEGRKASFHICWGIFQRGLFCQ